MEGANGNGVFRVILLLEGDEEWDVSEHEDEAAAAASAGNLIARMSRAGEWPRVGRRFFNPDRIVAIELRERQRWAGSSSRALWASQADGVA